LIISLLLLNTIRRHHEMCMKKIAWRLAFKQMFS
jgi:hypothetical protein